MYRISCILYRIACIFFNSINTILCAWCVTSYTLHMLRTHATIAAAYCNS
jgi:hypothetical protein